MDKQERERLRALSQELMRAHEAYFDRICNREPPMHYVAVRERWWRASREFQNALTPHLALRLLDALDAAEQRAEAAEALLREIGALKRHNANRLDNERRGVQPKHLTLNVPAELLVRMDEAAGEQTGEGGGT